jgi:hypothetical protein
LLHETIGDAQKEEIREFLETKELSFDCNFYNVIENNITSYENLKRFL